MTALSLSSRLGRLVLASGVAAIAATFLAGPAAASSGPHQAGSTATAATHAIKPKPAPPGNAYPAVKPVTVPKPARSAHAGQQAVRPMAGWGLSMTASSYRLWGTQTSTLNATTSFDVGPTAYWILIYEDGNIIQRCGTGYSCPVGVSYATPQTHEFGAAIAYYDGSNVQESYPSVSGFGCHFCVEWHGVSFTMSVGYPTLPINGVTTVTATASEDVGPSPFYVDIFDTTTGTLVNTDTCGYGTTCSATVNQSTAGAHKYIAYLADRTGVYPPTRLQSTSSPTWVTWTGTGLQLTLSGPASGTNYVPVTVTANENLSNPPYYIEVFDDDTGVLQGSCTAVTTCTVNAYGHNFGDNKLVAFVSSVQDSTYPPAGTQASSNVLDVTINERIP
jgi:hypothetical protein